LEPQQVSPGLVCAGRLSIASVTDTHGRRECLPTLAIQESLIRQRQSSPVWLEQQAEQRAAQARQERERSGGKHRNNASKKRYQAATAAIEKANPQYNFTNPDGLSVDLCHLLARRSHRTNPREPCRDWRAHDLIAARR